VVVFNAEDVQLGPDIAHYLARHGVKANVIRQQTDIDVGSALLSMVTDLNSDCIVMGAYGHPRLRERLLGGVTRTVLESMTVPVSMSN
jgi:nucleotide-binding universal stress UspA family protein